MCYWILKGLSQGSKQRLLTVAVLAALLATVGRVAYAEEPLTGTLRTVNPRAVGLGQTLRASPSGTSGIYQNPAVIAMTPLYHIEAMYQFTGQENMHTGGLAIVDSVTTIIAAGLAFNYSNITQSRTKHVAYDGRLAIAGGIGDVFYLGMTGRYLHVEQNKSSSKWGPIGRAALPPSGSQQVDGFTFDAGMALKAGKVVTLGIAGYNLTNTGSVFAPIELGGGISLNLFRIWLLELDPVIDFTSHDDVSVDINFGTEVFLLDALALRAGYMFDIYYDLHSLTAGVAYVHSRFSIDFGFMHEIVEDGRMLLGFSFKYFVS